MMSLSLNKLLSSFRKNSVNSKNNIQRAQITNDTSQLPSLELAFNLTKELITAQLARVDGLDNKANYIKGAATALVGTALVLQSTLLSSHQGSYCSLSMPYFFLVFPGSVKIIPNFLNLMPPLLQRAIPILPLLITFLIVLYISHQAYKIMDYYDVAANPKTLFDSYLEEPLIITQIDVFKRMMNNYEQNRKRIDRKALWVSHALFWLEIEAVALVLLLFYQAVC